MKLFLFMSVAVLFCSFSGCDACETIIQADLVLGSFNSSQVSSSSDGDVYEIQHDVLNTVSGFLNCEENIKSANSSIMQQKILYSQTVDFINSTVADIHDFSIRQLDAGDIANAIDRIKFLIDGYYCIISTVDHYDDVPERNEDNNWSDNPLSRNMINTGRIIKVENVFSAPKDKPIPGFVERISSKVEYLK